MKVLVIEPGKQPEEMEVKNELETMQDIVGGYIEAIYPFDDPIALVCNEEGKIEGLPPNRMLYSKDGRAYDVIVGTFFVCGLGKEDFVSLSQDLIDKYKKYFAIR
jgi:hypothetical protein